MPRLAHQDPSEGKDLHEALRDVSPVEAEEFKKNVLSPAEIERRKNRKATPTLSRPEVPMSDTALRASLIRLAYQNPSLRTDILPLVAKEASAPPPAKKPEAKVASLRTAAIRFAHANPALRKHVLAAIKEADEGSPEADKAELAKDADPASHDQNLASTWEKVDGKQAMDKTAAGPDSTGRNWKKHKVGGTTHWIWQGRAGEPIKQFMVIQKKAGAFDNSYWMTVKLEDGSFFQSPIQKAKPTDWFKRAAEIYAASQAAPPDFSTQPEMWKKIAAGDKTAADFSPERGEVEGVRDDLIAALKKKGIQAEDAVSSNVLYIGENKYAIHGPWLEGEGLGDRGKWIQKPTRAAWLAEAVKVLAGVAKK